MGQEPSHPTQGGTTLAWSISLALLLDAEEQGMGPEQSTPAWFISAEKGHVP